MRIKLPHVPYIANKMILDIANSSFVEIKDHLEKLKISIIEVLENDVLNERKLDEKVKELLEQQEDEMELMQVDRKNMFWLVKKKLAPEWGVILDSEEHHNHLAHQILKELVENDYINFMVSENRVKNLIFSSIEGYLKIYEKLEDEVYEKISNYKTKPVPGSEEYDLIFEKLYQEELRKKGYVLMKAYIYLENDTFLTAKACGKQGTFFGELVFNTSLTGYQEIISDPSYAGQFIVFSMPEIGIVGTNENDNESKGIFASGILMRELSSSFSNFRAEESLEKYLKRHEKIGIYELDTRYLVKMIRKNGNLRAVISTEISNKEDLKLALQNSAKIDEINFIKEVSTKEVYSHKQGVWNASLQKFNDAKRSMKKVAVIDYGVKINILNELVEAGFEVEVYPYDIKAEELIALYKKGEIQGVFLSNGPGEPKILKQEILEIKKLAQAKIPMLGICLGHQLLSNAFGYETYKMKFGQHGANHPVINLDTKTVEITAQNHNYNVPEELDQIAIITHRNLFGDNVEGVRYKNYPIISVQHHPEASSGPHESKYIFKEFMNLM